MRSNVCIECEVGAFQPGWKGWLHSLITAPVGDLWPRKGTLVFGGKVQYTERRRIMTLTVGKVNPGANLGDKVWVGRLGDKS